MLIIEELSCALINKGQTIISTHRAECVDRIIRNYNWQLQFQGDNEYRYTNNQKEEMTVT